MLGMIASAVGGLASTWLKGKQKVAEAKIEREAQALTNEADWNQVQARNARDSWKDEWLTLLVSIPMILAFFPDMVPYVEAGFEVLEGMPEWYQGLLFTVFAASFGVKKLASYKAGRL